jgi:hypothetical protein
VDFHYERFMHHLCHFTLKLFSGHKADALCCVPKWRDIACQSIGLGLVFSRGETGGFSAGISERQGGCRAGWRAIGCGMLFSSPLRREKREKPVEIAFFL